MSTKRNGSELIGLFATKAGISTTEAKSFIQALSETVTEVAISEGKATITGFGRFTISEVADREGTQPGTGESIIIPAHKRMNFTPYKKLAEMVNHLHEHKEAESETSVLGKDKPTTRLNNTFSEDFISKGNHTIPLQTQQTREIKTPMDNNKNNFTKLLNEIESQTSAKKPIEFVPPELAESEEGTDVEKANLINELGQIVEKKKGAMGGSLDIQIEDDELDSEQNSGQQPEQFNQKESLVSTQNKPIQRDTAANEKKKLASTDNSSESPNFVSVEENLLKELIGSIDDLKTVIHSLHVKSQQKNPSTNSTISFDKKIFIPGSFVGVFLLLISGFMIGNNVDRLFGNGVTDQASNSEQITLENNSTSSTQNEVLPSTSVQLANLTNEGTQSAMSSNSNTDNAANSEQPVTISDVNNSSFSDSPPLRTVTYNSDLGLYNMAQEIYGNPRLWVLLFQENFSTSQNPDDIADGTTLSIPNVAAPGSFSELDKERLRVALLQVAQAYEIAGKEDLAQSYRSASVYYPNTM